MFLGYSLADSEYDEAIHFVDELNVCLGRRNTLVWTV